MRVFLSAILSSALILSACGGGGDSDPGLPRLVIQPDDGRGPIIEAIAGATNNIRLTIYEITDLQSVVQSPAAPADSVVVRNHRQGRERRDRAGDRGPEPVRLRREFPADPADG
jgi:hypothetical protein